jgi:prophage maintenance system killer protein
VIEGEGGSIHLDVEAVFLVSRRVSRAPSHRPPTYEHYRDADLALQGAVLAHRIAEGQILVDGNKRTALEAMRLFLDINRVVLRAPQAELAGWMLDLAAGTTAEELAEC